MLDLRLLGPLEALVDGRPVVLGAPQQRALLAALALAPGSVLGVDALVAALWADRPPESAANILQGYVARLRAVLEPDRPRGQAASVLVTRAPGYLLAVAGGQTDAGRFRDLVRRGRAERDHDPVAAAATLRAALALWRGDALGDLGDLPVAVSARAELGELRRAALADRIDADLDTESAPGGHAELVAELAALVAADPLHEHRHAQLMLALYRAGRPADALAAFGHARRLLAEELGLDPGPELRALEAAILRHEVPKPRGTPRGAATAGSVPAASTARLTSGLTSFVGRDAELAEVRALLATRRLVTLTGPGGVGKTRLAVAAATGFGGEVCLVDLVPVTESAGVPAAVAVALDIREEPGRPLTETLAGTLAGAPMLILLDNCEHVVDGCAALVDTLLRAAPDVRMLATSRQPLGVVGDTVWPVPGLTGEAAVRLFAERAAAPFRLSADTGPVVARICARLDGMPLAIELAAGRTRMLSAAEIETRLDDRFGLLAAGQRGGPARHRTLSAVIAWSYQLLTRPERELFERLSVFAGHFGLAAATSVGGADAVDVLAELVDKSLVVRTEGLAGRSRYRLLDTLRRYARDRLDERGDQAAVRAAHAAHYATLADQLSPLTAGTLAPEWVERMGEESANLRSAARWSLAEADASAAATIMGGVWWLWWMHGPLAEGRELLAAALRITDDPTPPTRARLLYGVSSFALAQGELDEAEAAARECFEMSLAQGDDLGAGWGAGALGLAVWARGDYPAAAAYNEQVVALSRRSGDRFHEVMSLAGLGRVAADQGEFERAESLLAESAAVARAIGLRQGEGFAVGTLATVAYRRERDDEAVALARRALEAYRAAGSQEGIGAAQRIIGLVALRRGDIEQAASVLAERLALYRRHGMRGPLASCLEDIAELAVALARPVEATRLLAAAETLRREQGIPLPPADQGPHQRRLAQLRIELADEFTAVWADGAAMTWERAQRTGEALTASGMAGSALAVDLGHDLLPGRGPGQGVQHGFER
jgi:predicted ATPase/DNA-binding SARP family transcriptional activator